MKINNLAPNGVNLYVKAEFFNPAGSVTDRIAITIIEETVMRGDLRPRQTLVEATIGNTGIGLAMVCAATDYPIVNTMFDSFSTERRELIRSLEMIAVCCTEAIQALRWTSIVEYFTALRLKGRSPFYQIFCLL